MAATFDVDALLAEVSSDAPCGANMEYDAAFLELERAAQGKPEQQMGDNIIPAEEPDWGDVRRKALELLERTKDLRVLALLSRAAVQTDGLCGLRDALALMRGVVEHFWEGVHPELDPDDENDPTMRVNIIAQLCNEETMLRSVRMMPLVASKAFGRFGMRDLEMAAGNLSVPEGEEAPDSASIDAAFMDCDAEQLQTAAVEAGLAVEHALALEEILTERLGAAQAPDLGAFRDLLNRSIQILTERLARRGVALGAEEPGSAKQDDGGTSSSGTPAESVSQPQSGEITCREDVILMLDKACKYYERDEPSSPVPLLLIRAKRLVSKSFIDIIKDLAPDGLTQVQTIRGDAGVDNED